MSEPAPAVDVLVVGAGPTGLALAAQAHAHGATVRIVDRNADRAHESRALAIQPRTLEMLAGAGLAGTLVERGNPGVQLCFHAGRRQLLLPLFDLGMADTDYPFLLFLSQAVTEQVLVEHLSQRGVRVEREVTLVECADTGDAVTGTLRLRDGAEQRVRARYLAGCDGVHSTVRKQAGIRFTGDAYPQVFALADLEVDGLAPDTVHGYFGAGGPLLFFPLEEPASWRTITLRPPGGWPDRTGDPDAPVTLADLQALADESTGGRLRLRDPVWLTDFRLHRRHADSYRSGRLFLAGDAAHVHTPAGGQGMNIGIQDAWNLGWKLALVSRGVADPALLDSYHAERAPVGRAVVRLTDRAFRVATATNPVARFMRTRLVPRVLPLARRFPRARAAGFRALAELTIDHRGSNAVQEGRPAPRRGPRAGDRLPSAPVMVDGARRSLYEALAAPGFQLLLCGPPVQWPADQLGELTRRYAGLLAVHTLAATSAAGSWYDVDGVALPRLGVRDAAHAQYLVRPDRHVGYRAAGTDLAGLRGYLSRWLPRPAAGGSG